MTEVITALFLLEAKCVKLGVVVPPLMKEPITSPIPVRTGNSPDIPTNKSENPAAPDMAAVIELPPRRMISGTEM